jgi:hypothetical protein
MFYLHSLLPPTVDTKLSIPSVTTGNKGYVSHHGLAIYNKKYLKAKEVELWKFKYFTM